MKRNLLLPGVKPSPVFSDVRRASSVVHIPLCYSCTFYNLPGYRRQSFSYNFFHFFSIPVCLFVQVGANLFNQVKN